LKLYIFLWTKLDGWVMGTLPGVTVVGGSRPSFEKIKFRMNSRG